VGSTVLPAFVGFLLSLLFYFEDQDYASEMLGNLSATRHYNPEGCTLHSLCCENLKSRRYVLQVCTKADKNTVTEL
jgi:hypothetical protein